MSSVRTPEIAQAAQRCRAYLQEKYPEAARRLIERSNTPPGDDHPVIDFLQARIDVYLEIPRKQRTQMDWINLADALTVVHAYREARRAAPRVVAPGREQVTLPAVSAADVSTAHLSERTIQGLQSVATGRVEDDELILPIVYDKGGEGFMVHVTPDVSTADLEAYPLDLQDVMRLAIDQDCAWINFDRDGPIVDGLPVYDGQVSEVSFDRGP